MNSIHIDDNSPYNFISHKSVDNLDTFITKSIHRISTENNPRVIVLETWLMLDYAIRQLIIWGIGADSNSTVEFDLRNELLPVGFKNCLDFLINLKKRQEKLSVDPNEKCLKLPIRFWRFVNETEKSDRDTILRTIYAYQKKMNPEYLTPEEVSHVSIDGVQIDLKTTKEKLEYRTVDEHWLTVTSQLNDKWIKTATKINKARNDAAHSYNEEQVFVCFGINGDDKTEKLRKVCIEIVSSLLKVEINK